MTNDSTLSYNENRNLLGRYSLFLPYLLLDISGNENDINEMKENQEVVEKYLPVVFTLLEISRK